MNFALPDLYDFLRGPGLVISILVFLSGSLYRLTRLIHATRKIRNSNILSGSFLYNRSIADRSGFLRKCFSVLSLKLRNSIFSTNPVISIISLVFHILLFITPVFLSAHNIIADLTFGLSLFTIPEQLSDVFTVLIIAAGGFFLARRILIPRVRILSTFRDYFILILVMAPFISAFAAYHHFFNYRYSVFIHMITGELAIMIIPFTSLIHMPFIIFSRFFIDSEYSIMTGNRSW